MVDAPLTEPHIVLDMASPDRYTVARLNTTLEKNPEKLWIALAAMGEMALDSAELNSMGPAEPHEALLLDEVFREGVDQDIEFDPETEDILAADERQQSLIQQLRAQRPRNLGKHQVPGTEDNPGALRYRDIIRRRRLGVIILRRMQWNKKQQELEESRLPLAS